MPLGKHSLVAVIVIACMIAVLLSNSSFLSRAFARVASAAMATSSAITPYSMAFVTAPNKDVARTLAQKIGK